MPKITSGDITTFCPILQLLPILEFFIICEKCHILVPLPISIVESINQLKAIDTILVELSTYDIEIKIKPHPVHEISTIKNFITNLKFHNYRIVNDDFQICAQQSNLLIGSTTSSCVEALIYGLRVIILSPPNGVTQNPIPDVAKNQWKVCHGSKELKQEVEVSISMSRDNHEINHEVIMQCFTKTTPQSVRAFIENIG